MTTKPSTEKQLVPEQVLFVPDYPHSVLKVTLPKIIGRASEFPIVIYERLKSFCVENKICISVLPQLPTYVLRIEGGLIAAERRRFIIGNRCVSYVDQQTVDMCVLIEALRVISPSFEKPVETKAGEFPENRDSSFVKGFVKGFRINQAQQVAYNKANPAERFREPHQDPENPEFFF